MKPLASSFQIFLIPITAHGAAFVPGGSDEHQLIAMNGDHGQAIVADRNGNHAEVHGIINDAFQDLGSLRTADANGHARILFFELRKNLRQDVETGGFICADNDFSFGHPLHLREGGDDVSASLQCLLSVFLEGFARHAPRPYNSGMAEPLNYATPSGGSNLPIIGGYLAIAGTFIGTAIFVAGWAMGGLIFGAVGDRIGRAKTLTLTVLMYSVFTGLSAFATTLS